MADRPVWQVGNRNPSITEVIEIDGEPFDLLDPVVSAVTFSMRPLGSDDPKVNAQPAQVEQVGAVDVGAVRYDWQAADVDTAGEYLVWWTVTTGGLTQDVGEAVIEFRAHAPLDHSYVELERMKETLTLQGVTYADGDIMDNLIAASRAVEDETGRVFIPSVALQERYFDATTPDYLRIDDLITLSSLTVDRDGDGVFEETWATTDYILGAQNAVALGEPYTFIETRRNGDYSFPPNHYRGSIKITGTFGWATVPRNVITAVTALTARWVKRNREAPFGVVGVGPDGEAVRISQSDPDIARMLARYTRKKLFV